MVTKAVIGQGCTLTWNTETIGEGTVARGPAVKPNLVDATNFDSGGWEERIGGVKKPGTIHWESNLIDDASTNEGLWAVINDDGTAKTWILTYASGWSFTGSGIISYETSSNPTSPERISIDIEITGEVTATSPT